MSTCVTNHTTGSKPRIVPVATDKPVYVVYHGRQYLGSDGAIRQHPEWMSYASAERAIALHEATLVEYAPLSALSDVWWRGDPALPAQS